MVGEYSYVLKPYIMEVPLDSHLLLYAITFESSSPIVEGYPWVLKSCLVEASLDPQVPYSKSTLRSSSPILWRYH